MDETIDKPIFYKKLSDDKVINLTGENSSGKSTIAMNYRNDNHYIVIEYDLIFLNPKVGTIEYDLKQMLTKKYGDSLFKFEKEIGINQVKENFTTMYNEIISYFSQSGKTIVLDGSQLRLIKDAKEIKGEIIALRPSLQTCVSHSLKNFMENNPQATKEEIQKYIQTRINTLHKFNPMFNDLLLQVEKLSDVRQMNQQFDYSQIQMYLNEKAKEYLKIIQIEYGKFMSEKQINFMKRLLTFDFVIVEQNVNSYFNNQQNCINNDSTLNDFEKIEEIRKLTVPLAHGGRVFEDNIIHFYPSILLSKTSSLTTDELKQKCDEILIHELLHYFIRPQNLDIQNKPELKEINSFTTEGLVDMCTRDINKKYGLFSNYNSLYGTNVIFMREALSNISNDEERMRLVFNGSIDEIYKKITTSQYNGFQKFIDSRDKKTKFDTIIAQISNACFPDMKHTESSQRFLYNFSANFKSKVESLEAIEKMSKQRFSEAMPFITQQINNYRQNKYFDQRSQSEIQLANQIRAKNQAIAEKKQNDKSKTLVKTNTSSSPSKGYINVVILLLGICFVASVLSYIIYSNLR